MSPPTRTSPHSSPACAPLVLEPRPSRRLLAGWLAAHAAAAAGLAAAGVGAGVAALGIAAVLLHGWLRRPGPTPAVRRAADGRWDVPALGVSAAKLDAGTRCHPEWVRLVLRDGVRARRRSVTVLLLRDQLDDEVWRTLQVALRGAAERSDERFGDFR